MKKLTPLEIILFHWHTTLVDTSETLYHALDDVLPQYGTIVCLGLRSGLRCWRGEIRRRCLPSVTA